MLRNVSPKKIWFGIIFLLALIFVPIFSHAQSAYFLQSVIDNNKFQYQGNVLMSNSGFADDQTQQVEYQLGWFHGMNMYSVPPAATSANSSAVKSYFGKFVLKPGPGGLDEAQGKTADPKTESMPFTFEPHETGFWPWSKHNDASAQDANQAYKIQETLFPDLNDALVLLNGGHPFTDMNSLLNMSNELAGAISAGQNGGVQTVGNTGFTLQVGKRASYSSGQPATDPKTGISTSDYVLLTDTNHNNAQYEFVYQMLKGYEQKDPSNPTLYNSTFKDDTKYITWNMLIVQAQYAYFEKGITATNASSVSKPGPLESALVSLFQNLFNSLRNLLGLYSIGDLVFNGGVRSSIAWVHGIMPKQWSDIAMLYQWIFQLIAWSLITLAIVKALIQRNVATVNSHMRVSLIEDIQNLLITALILAFIVPMINMFMVLNEKLVAVFGAVSPNMTELSGVNNYSDALGGILIQFFYFIVSLYINFVYIMRAITVAILIASAPLFVVSIAFGAKWRPLFSKWMKELIGNIFLQSFQAFVLSFFIQLSTSSRGIENLVVMFAMIPMTEFFRKMIVGEAGGISHMLGTSALTSGAAMVGGAIGGGIGAAKGKLMGGSSGSSSGVGSRESSSTDGSASAGGAMAGRSDRIQGNAKNAPSLSKINSTRESLANKETPVHIAENGNHRDFASYKGDGFNTQQSVRDKAQEKMSAISERMNTPGGQAAMKIGGGAVRTVAGAGRVMMGAGTALAMGGVEGGTGLANMGLKHVQAGAGHMGGGAMDVTGGSISQASSALEQNAQEHVSTLPNGDVQVHRNAEVMANQGILKARMEDVQGSKSQNAVYTYNKERLTGADNQNLTSAVDAFKSGNADLKDHYRKHGIERVSKDGMGNYVVAYNPIGQSKLGIKSVNMSGGHVIETKNSYDPLATKKTISVPAYAPPTQQPTQSASQNSGSQSK